MAVPFFGNGPITVTGTAQSLTQLLGLSQQAAFGHGSIRAGVANVGTIFFGKANLTAGANQLGYLLLKEAFDVALEGVYTNTNELYLIASNPGDTVYIVLAA